MTISEELGAIMLDDVKTVADIVSSAVTAIAIVIGAAWAYFKFIKGRTLRPRLEVTILGQWPPVAGNEMLHARVTVRNIGTSVVTLIQKGTGLRLSRLSDEQDTPPLAAVWTKVKTYEILADHAWIEPGELISDDLLLPATVPAGEPLRCDVRLVWRWHRGKKNIVVSARRIILRDRAKQNVTKGKGTESMTESPEAPQAGEDRDITREWENDKGQGAIGQHKESDAVAQKDEDDEVTEDWQTDK